MKSLTILSFLWKCYNLWWLPPGVCELRSLLAIFPAAGNGESCLGPVFRPFTNSHQYRFQIRLRLVDVSAFLDKKVTKMCPKYLLTHYYYKWSSQYQTLIKIDLAKFITVYNIIKCTPCMRIRIWPVLGLCIQYIRLILAAHDLPV